MAQKTNPSPGDFIKLVQNFFEMIEEELNEEAITEMSKEQFKIFVKRNIKNAALKYFKIIQESYSKVKGIQYPNLEIQHYLTSQNFTNKECETLFALRSHTLRGFQANSVSSNRNNMSFSLQCDDTSQRYWPKILAQLENKDVLAAQMIEYSHIFKTLEQQKEAVRIFTRLLDVTEGLLQEDTTPTNGTTLDTAALTSQGSDGDLYQ